MLAEVPRFHRAAQRVLDHGDPVGQVLADFLRTGGFSRYFTAHFVLPLVAAVWSCPSGTALRYPARYLFAFLANHGMLSVSGSPPWRTVTGGSRRYVELAAKRLADIRLSTPVRAVRRYPDHAEVRDAAGETYRFDAVVIAAHADQALRLLDPPTDAERDVLGAFTYTQNPALLHTDVTLLPRRPAVRRRGTTSSAAANRTTPHRGSATTPARAAGDPAARAPSPGGGPVTSTRTRTHQPWTADPERWPDVAVAAGSPARAAVARAVFGTAVARLPVRVRLADDSADSRGADSRGADSRGADSRGLHGGGGPAAPVMHIHRPREFFRRLGASGLIGFGESYLAGDWDSADLTGLLTVFAAHAADLVPPWLQRLRRLAVRRQPPDDLQTVAGARRNIGRHYDLSNDLFALFLDETMTYSCALFPERDGAPVAADLAGAQHRKIDRLLDRAGVGPGCRLLEVGTGWGELAIRAARRGATVRTITISAEQQALAARRVAEAGLAGRVSVELRDYRDLDGRFDAICSVEMLEAVGERYWDAYFAALDRHLAPGGRIALQIITMPHDRMLATRHTYTWIQKYIFPGGLLPSVTAIGDSLARTRLRITGREDFGAHYAETLRIWRERFGARTADVARLGFDEVFNRMWTFYLCYSEAGFRAGYIDVSQLTLARTPL